MTVNKLVAQWWVHWNEVDGNGDRKFYMNQILSTLLLEGDDLLVKLRNRMQTIIEWGLQKRMAEVKGRYAAVARADERATNQALELKRGADSSALAASKSESTTSTGNKRSHSRRDSNSELMAHAAASSA